MGLYSRRTMAEKRKLGEEAGPEAPSPELARSQSPELEPEDVPQKWRKSKKKSKRRKEGYTEEEDAFIVQAVKAGGANKATWQSIINGWDWGEDPPSVLAIKVPLPLLQFVPPLPFVYDSPSLVF